MSPPPAARIMPSLRPNFIFRGAEIGRADQQPADKLLGLVDALDAGKHRAAVATAQTERELEELFGRGHVFGGQHAADPQIDLRELVERDLPAKAARPAAGRRCLRPARRRAAASAVSGSALAAIMASTFFRSTRCMRCWKRATGAAQQRPLRLLPARRSGRRAVRRSAGPSRGSTGAR